MADRCSSAFLDQYRTVTAVLSVSFAILMLRGGMKTTDLKDRLKDAAFMHLRSF